MAWVGPIQNVAFSSTTAAATLTFSPTATMAVGTLVVIGWNVNANQPNATSCADNSTQAGTANTWTLLGGVGGANLGGSSVYCRLTRSILSTNVITVTLPIATGNRRSGRMLSFTGVVAAGSALEQGLNVNPQTTSPITLGPTSLVGPISAGGLVLAFSYWRGGAVASGFSNSTGGYTAVATTSSGGTTSRHEVNAAYKSPTTTAAETDVHAFTSVTIVGGQIMVFKGVVGTAYTKSLTGAARFAGSPALSKTFRRFIAAEHPTAGTVTKSPASRRFTALVKPVGIVAPQQSLVRSLADAALDFTGAVARAPARLFSASITPTGARTSLKSVAQAVSGALSFVGAQTHIAGKALPASLTPVGSEGRVASLSQILDAAVLQPVGAVNRLTSRVLAAAVLRPVGMMASASRGAMSGALSFTGSVVGSLPQRTLSAALDFAGNDVTRDIARRVVSALVASGVMHTQYIPPPRPPFPGGGGWGTPMPDSFFMRYKPTLRRQR